MMLVGGGKEEKVGGEIKWIGGRIIFSPLLRIMIPWGQIMGIWKWSLVGEFFLEGSVDVRICISWFVAKNWAIAPFLFCLESPFLESQAKPSINACELKGSSLGWCWECASGKLGCFWLMNCFGETLYSQLLPSLFCKTLWKVIFSRCLANCWISSIQQVNPFSYLSKKESQTPTHLANSYWAFDGNKL